jgi:hypothetical protein
MDFVNVAILGSLVSAAVLVLALRNLQARRERKGATPEPEVRSFEASDYSPMKRLFADEEIAFLRSQPGFQPEIERRFKKQRQNIFKLYLRRLECDYGRMSAALRELIVSAPEDQSELLAELARQDRLFRLGLLRVRVGVALHGLSLAPAPAAIDSLVQATARLNAMLSALTAVPALEASA